MITQLRTPSMTGNVTDPAWAADGRRLAFVMSGSIWVMNSDGTAMRQVTTGGTDSEPAWSADGRRIAFMRSAMVHVVDVNGGNLRALAGGGYLPHGPSWSADGVSIAWSGGCSAPGSLNCVRVVGANDGVLGADLSAASPATICADGGRYDDRTPAWSRDGSQIAFSARGTGSNDTDICAMGADGGGRRDITNSQDVREAWPAWAPDGTAVAYIANVQPTDSEQGVFVIPATGGAARRITAGLDDTPSWGRVPDVAPELFSGTPVGDAIDGTAFADRLLGLTGDDVLNGLGGNDRLAGGPGNDRLTGGPGNDVLDGGSGIDTFAGGPGNDVVNAADGRTERVSCGPGRDRARADRADKLTGCEKVTRIRSS